MNHVLQNRVSSISTLILSCMAICFFAPDIHAETPYWPMIGYDRAHTGHNRAEMNLYPPFPVEVIYQIGNGLGGLSSYDEFVFATAETDTNRMKALDIPTGDILWSYLIPESGGGPSHTPAVWDSLVYGSGQHGDGLHCVNSRTGEMVWFQPMGNLFRKHVTVDEGRVYVQAIGDRLYCLDGLSGSTIWSRPSDGAATPAIVGDTIFASLHSDSLYAFHKVSSGRLWAVPVPVSESVLVAGDSLLYVKNNPTSIMAVRQQDGSVIWSREFPGETVGEANTGCFAYAENRLFVSMWEDSSGSGKVYALEGNTGVPIWDYTFDDTGAFPAIIANGVVYVSGWRDQTLYAFDPSTGDTIATLPGLSNYYIVSDGKLIAGGSGNSLHILSMESVGIDGEEEAEPPLPRTVVLEQNFPNPFNPQTEIRYRLEAPGNQVRLSIFDLRGHLVRKLVDQTQTAGRYAVRWDGKNNSGSPMSSGMYLYRLEVGREGVRQTDTASRKMILLK